MSENSEKEIKCPFLEFAQPETTSLREFANSCHQAGMNRYMAMFVSCQITYRQKGLMAVLRGEIPDLYRLDAVPTVSHEDLYQKYLSEIRVQADAAAVDGKITLQDLIKMKEWIAEQENVPVLDASKIETALAFVRAGGDFETGLVNVDDLFTLLQGKEPDGFGWVTASSLSKARRMARWSE